MVEREVGGCRQVMQIAVPCDAHVCTHMHIDALHARGETSNIKHQQHPGGRDTGTRDYKTQDHARLGAMDQTHTDSTTASYTVPTLVL
jgi:hypothetical protein